MDASERRVMGIVVSAQRIRELGPAVAWKVLSIGARYGFRWDWRATYEAEAQGAFHTDVLVSSALPTRDALADACKELALASVPYFIDEMRESVQPAPAAFMEV